MTPLPPRDNDDTTYWQIIADGALVDERDVAVGNVVVLLGPGGDIPELLRVLLHTELSLGRRNSLGGQRVHRQISESLRKSLGKISERLCKLLVRNQSACKNCSVVDPK